jgi:DNA-binding response OmpR family regulator
VRVLVLSSGRMLQMFLEDMLAPLDCQHGLIVEAATLRDVQAAHDDPAVLLYLERWDTSVAPLVAELSAAASVYAVLEGTLSPASYLAILQAGATDVAAADPASLRALALKLHRRHVEVHGPRWLIGNLVIDAVEQRVGCQGRWVVLGAAEIRVLWSLLRPSARGQGLRSEQLAAHMGVAPGTVRNIVQRLHRAIQEGLEHPAVLHHDPKRGYFLLLEEPASRPSSTS